MEMDTSGNSRAQRIWGRMLEARDKTEVSLSRAKSLTASWKETDGLPTPIRRAKAFERIVNEIPIYVDDEQLLVGDFRAADAEEMSGHARGAWMWLTNGRASAGRRASTRTSPRTTRGCRSR